MGLNKEEIKNLYNCGMSSTQLAQNYGVSKTAILYQLKKANATIRKPIVLNKDEVISLYNSGLSTIEIGTKFCVSHTKIINILKCAGIDRRTKKEALQKHARSNICVICGKLFRPKQKWTDTTRLDKKTCSKECKHVLLSKINKKETGHSQAYYQRIRKELKPDVCEFCGAVPPIRLDTHHIDRNHNNNTKENILVLCVKCHAHLHYLEDDRGLKGYNPNGGTMNG